MAELFKNIYNKNYIELVSNCIKKNYEEFDIENFTKSVFDESWEKLELKQRMRHIAVTLHQFLPSDYLESIKILKDSSSLISIEYGLENMIFQDFVEVYGLEYFDISLDTLEHFTKNASSEFAIRVYILKDQNKTMAKMKQWAKSDNEHVRRLSSEGCRSRLPWAVALPSFKKDPSEVLEILELLQDDSSEYVRKSVANNLNDISKDNPSLVIDIVKKWIGQNKLKDKLLKHGSRTLLKQSDKKILELFGYKSVQNIKVENFKIQKEVKIGESLEFSFDINSHESLEKLRIEYIVQFVRLRGKTGKKVFMISDGIFDKKSKKVVKLHSFRPITTRKYYNGEHKIYLLINGIEFVSGKFNII